MKRNLRARAVLFGQVLPALVAGSSLAGCEPKVRPWATDAPDGGRQPDSIQTEPTTAAVAPPPVASADLGEAQPTVSGLEPSAVGGQSGGAVLPEACNADAGSCAETSDAGPVPVPCVPTGPRDCSSELDNDCDGQPDNIVDDVCQCVPATIETCDEHPGADGLGACRPGTRTCVASEDGATSAWGECEGSVGPGEADSCEVAGDDTDCDGTPNEGCDCVDGVVQTGCGSSTDLGVCAFGTSTCVNGAFGECVGAIPPAARDTCAPGDDSNCNGIPNEGCACVNGETEPCGPPNVGVCRSGVRTCANGVFGQCVGAVNASSRNCNSAADNDCDGRPDNTIDNVCQCVIGTTQTCGTHPQDGVGACRAGQQSCVAGPNNSSSAFGTCTGSVGPAPQDSCSVADDDANCNGQANDRCECIGQDDSACSSNPNASRCNGNGQCAPCQVNSDCALVSGGRNTCDGGQCVPDILAFGDPCSEGDDDRCETGLCAPYYLDGDRDGYPPANATETFLCGAAAEIPDGFTRLTPTGRTIDCLDTNNEVNPGQAAFFTQPAGDHGFDYNCDGEEEKNFMPIIDDAICAADGADGTCSRSGIIGDTPCGEVMVAGACILDGPSSCRQFTADGAGRRACK